MGRPKPWHGNDQKPPATDKGLSGVVAKVRAKVFSGSDRHSELVGLLRIMVAPGNVTRWSRLRRALRLVGHRASTASEIVLGVLEVVPTARTGRLPPRGRGPRCVYGVGLAVNPTKLRLAMEHTWEKRLTSEGLAQDIPAIAKEYRMAPLPALKGGGRLHELVTRVHQRREDASIYFSLASEYLHRNGWGHHPPGHKRIWALHVEGATKEEIARECGKSETSIQSILDFHRARAGLTHR